MTKGIFSIVTLSAFVIFTISCTMKYVNERKRGIHKKGSGKDVFSRALFIREKQEKY